VLQEVVILGEQLHSSLNFVFQGIRHSLRQFLLVNGISLDVYLKFLV
jgi:hypothetical protein